MIGRSTPRRTRLRSINLLAVRPRREVSWEQNEGGHVVLVRRRPAVRGLRTLASWTFYMMAPARIRLDALGSFVWSELDGETTVAGLAHRVRERFGEDAEPVEQRLGQFVRLLHRERFISYPELDRRP